MSAFSLLLDLLAVQAVPEPNAIYEGGGVSVELGADSEGEGEGADHGDVVPVVELREWHVLVRHGYSVGERTGAPGNGDLRLLKRMLGHDSWSITVRLEWCIFLPL